MKLRVTAHDEVAPDIASANEGGVMEFNFTEGPMNGAAQVFACARSGEGELVGGAAGRRWGEHCELLYLWVKPALRHHGLGSELLAAFERQAASHGCRFFILDTISFQAPRFYVRHGYQGAARDVRLPAGDHQIQPAQDAGCCLTSTIRYAPIDSAAQSVSDKVPA